jgi:hypothetical protein
MRINENVALAKAILNKQGITTDSPEYQDYLKIREICGTGHGYVGVLTRIRFQDGVTDMDEIASIYDILKNSKIDVGKLNKMTYDDILNTFYDEFKTSEKNEDYEVVFKDSEYTYYQVHTYKGIMKTGSPSWCLKTKSNWDKYQSVYPKQFVVVSNRYKNRLAVPDDDILSTYSSKKSFVRYGISVNDSSHDDVVKWTACDDNNKICKFEPDNWTFWGVMCTLLNVLAGINKSYYDSFRGCKKIEGTKNWHEIVEQEKTFERLNLPKDFIDEKSKLYMILSTSYSSSPVLLVMSDSCPRGFYPTKAKHDVIPSILSGDVSKKILEDYANQSNSEIFYGVKLKKGAMTLDEVKKDKDFITMIDNWMIFNRNDKYIVVVNSNPVEYNLPTLTITQEQFNFGDIEPLFFYLKKDGMKPVGWTTNDLVVTDYHRKVIDTITGRKTTNTESEPRVKKFWDIFKKK